MTAGSGGRAALLDVLVIGAGISGRSSATRLLEAGVSDVVLLEQPASGAACAVTGCPGRPSDLPSLLGTASFEPHRLDSHTRFERRVKDLTFDDQHGNWVARTSGGKRFFARSVVLATGSWAAPRVPDLRGLDRFAGEILHTTRWDPHLDLTGERIAVIGTGATAVQIVPGLAERAGRLKVFQRTPRWILPRPDTVIGNRLLAALPVSRSMAKRVLVHAHEPWALSGLRRHALTGLIGQLGRALLRHQVGDSWMRRLLTPDHRPGDRPTLVSSEYYPALQLPNCELVTWPIATISEAGIRTADAVEHRFDRIVLATGVQPAEPDLPFPVVGRDGRALAGNWSDGVHAYNGVSIAGFPNLFLMPEPNPTASDSSASLYLGSRIGYMVRAITMMRTQGIRTMDVTPEAHESFTRRLQTRPPLDGRSSNGRYRSTHRPQFGSLLYPASVSEYASLTSRLRLGDYAIDR